MTSERGRELLDEGLEARAGNEILAGGYRSRLITPSRPTSIHDYWASSLGVKDRASETSATNPIRQGRKGSKRQNLCCVPKSSMEHDARTMST